MSAQRTVSIQEAVHMVDNQDLVICSEKFTYLSLRQGAVLTSEKDGQKRKDITTMYRNRSKNLADISLDEYFYSHFCREVLKDCLLYTSPSPRDEVLSRMPSSA